MRESISKGDYVAVKLSNGEYYAGTLVNFRAEGVGFVFLEDAVSVGGRTMSLFAFVEESREKWEPPVRTLQEARWISTEEADWLLLSNIVGIVKCSPAVKAFILAEKGEGDKDVN